MKVASSKDELIKYRYDWADLQRHEGVYIMEDSGSTDAIYYVSIAPKPVDTGWRNVYVENAVLVFNASSRELYTANANGTAKFIKIEHGGIVFDILFNIVPPVKPTPVPMGNWVESSFKNEI